MLVLLFLTILLCQTPQPHSTSSPTLRSLPVFLYWIPTFNIHLCNKNGGGHQGTLDYTMTMWKQCSRDGQPFGCAVLFPLLRITLPSFLSLSPPSYHCPLLPITVPSFPSLSPPPHHCPLRPLLPITVPSVLSFPSLSPPPHHCPLLPITIPSFPSLSPPPHHCPLLPITVPSSPSLSPPSHHCPLLPITVPSSPSLSPPSHHCPLLPITVPSSPSHHVIMADCFFPLLSRYSLLPPI